MTEPLRSRHWIGEYLSGYHLGMRVTEVKPGQFDGTPHEPIVCRDVNLRPATADEWAEWVDDEGEW
jgi:hypothetical protein